jgi:outer membrane receptor for ferric coprogen and ferric-rhodotorulic acid
MRLSVAMAVACLTLVGLSGADESQASIKKHTDIPAEGLGTALQALAKDRNFQIIYVSEEIDVLRTQGAVGEFTSDEALKQLLNGTGLTFRYLDANTVTVVPIAGAAPPPSDAESTPTKATSEDLATKAKPTADAGDSKKSFWDRLHLAQADQGTSSSPSSANEKTSEKKSESEQLEQITVTGQYQFLSADTSGATGLPLPIEKVPQSISLVSNDFIEAANLKTLGEIAEYTPGAINVGNQGNTGSLLKLRGFDAGRTIDGINTLQTIPWYEPEYAIFDRIEVVKGPSSVVYGISSPGGLTNFVTKSATPQTIDYVSVQAGSWNSFRAEGQLAGSLDSAGKVRAIGVVVRDQGDSFMDVMNHSKTTVYGGVNVDLSDSVTAYLHGGYERHVRTAFDGIPTEADGSPAPVPRSFFIGSKNIDLTTSVYHGEGNLTWRATDMLEFSLKGNYEKSDTDGGFAFGFGLAPNGDFTLAELPIR